MLNIQEKWWLWPSACLCDMDACSWYAACSHWLSPVHSVCSVTTSSKCYAYAAEARTFWTWNRISGKLRGFSILAIDNTSWISARVLLKWQHHFLGSVAQLRYGALQWTSTCPGLSSSTHNKVMVAALLWQCQAKQSVLTAHVLAVTRKLHRYNDHCRLSWRTRFDRRITYVCCDKNFLNGPLRNVRVIVKTYVTACSYTKRAVLTYVAYADLG